MILRRLHAIGFGAPTSTTYAILAGGVIALPFTRIEQGLKARLHGLIQPAANTSCEVKLQKVMADGNQMDLPGATLRVSNGANAKVQTVEGNEFPVASLEGENLIALQAMVRVTGGTTQLRGLYLALYEATKAVAPLSRGRTS